MKIAFIARGLDDNAGGVRQVIESIVKEINKVKDNNEYYIIYNSKKFLGLCNNHKEIVLEGKNKFIWDWIKLPVKLRQLKIDATIFPKNIIPWFVPGNKYNIVHDLAYFDKKIGEYKFFDTLYMRLNMKRSCLIANKIFTISNSSKQDIVNILGIKPSKIVVAYNSYDEKFGVIDNVNILKRIKYKYNLPDKFIFYAGSLSPRKNILRLVKAFNNIAVSADLDLVLASSKSWGDKKVLKEISISKFKNRIHIIKPINEEMPILYNLATMFVYPSLYEGFGLPILEAQACGCPVITSNKTSCPEVAGDSAIIIDPYNVKEIENAILKLVNDSIFRKNLIEKGFNNIKRFSWKKTLSVIMNTIKEDFIK